MIEIKHYPLMQSLQTAISNDKEVILTLQMLSSGPEPGDSFSGKFKIEAYDSVKQKLIGRFVWPDSSLNNRSFYRYEIIKVIIAD